MKTEAVVDVQSTCYRRGVMLVLFAGLLWSLGGVGIRMIEAVDGWQIIFFRSAGMALFILIAIVIRSRRNVVQSFSKAGKIGLIAGVCFGSSFITNIYAMLNNSIANVSFIASSVPFFVALLGWLFLREKVRRKTWVAISISMLGILVMVVTSLTNQEWWRMLLPFLMVIGYATGTVAIRYGKDVDMLPALFIAAFFSMCFSGSMISEFSLSSNDLMICLGLGVVQSGAGMALFTIGARYVPAAELTLLGLIEVVLSPLWVWMAVGEMPAFWTLAGGMIVLLGVMVQASGTRRSVAASVG
ncbi:DMT family transporter [Parasalinivibrio latis]